MRLGTRLTQPLTLLMRPKLYPAANSLVLASLPAPRPESIWLRWRIRLAGAVSRTGVLMGLRAGLAGRLMLLCQK